MEKRKYLPDSYRPTIEEANKYIALTYSDNPEVGNEKERTLVELFEEQMPKNVDIHDILVKCATLNSLANTNIIDVYYVAKHIYDLKIDERLKNGDYDLVDDISKVKIKGKEHHFYSFASKYCSYHQPDLYSIYDRYVNIVLSELQSTDPFSNFRSGELRQYKCYMKALEDFRKRYGLIEYSKKDLDKYLWLFGKECVSNYNKNKK